MNYELSLPKTRGTQIGLAYQQHAGSDLPCDRGVLVDASTGPPWRRSAHVRPPPGDPHELLRQHLPFVDGDLAAVDTPRDGRRPRGSSASGGIAVVHLSARGARRFGLVLPGARVSAVSRAISRADRGNPKRRRGKLA